MRGNIFDTLLLSIMSFVVSYDLGLYPIARASLAHSDDGVSLPLTDNGFQVSYLIVSTVSACIAAPLLCDGIGRRLAMLLAGILLTLGAAVQSASDGLVNYYAGRFITALAAGILWTAVFLYVTEVAPKEFRGGAICLQVLALNWGQFTAGLCQKYLQSYWRILTELECVLGAIFCIGVYFLPYSPRWLLSKGRDQDALIVLAKLRADGDPGALVVQNEYDGIKSAINPERQARLGWRDLLHSSMWRRLVLAVAISLFPNLIVTVAIAQWVPTVNVLDNNVEFDPWAVIILIACLAPVVSIVTIDRIGRRKTLVWGAIVMAICTLSIGILVVTSMSDSPTLNQFPVIAWNTHAVLLGALSLSLVAITAYYLTLFPISWLYPAELFPIPFRAKVLGLVTAIRWILNYFLPSSLAHFLAIAPSLAIFVVLVICIVLGVVAWYRLPETAMLSLEEVETVAQWGQGSPGSPRTSVVIDFVVHGSSPSRSRRSTPLGWLRTQYHGNALDHASIGTFNTDGGTRDDPMGSAFDLPRTTIKRGLFGSDKDQLKRYNLPPTFISPPPPHSPPPRSLMRPTSSHLWRSPPSDAGGGSLPSDDDDDSVPPDLDINNIVHEPSGRRHTIDGTTIEDTIPSTLGAATESAVRYASGGPGSVYTSSDEGGLERVSDRENGVEPELPQLWHTGSIFSLTPRGSLSVVESRRVSGQQFPWTGETTERSSPVVYSSEGEDSSYTYI